jgi:hypothetical protein
MRVEKKLWEARIFFRSFRTLKRLRAISRAIKVLLFILHRFFKEFYENYTCWCLTTFYTCKLRHFLFFGVRSVREGKSFTILKGQGTPFQVGLHKWGKFLLPFFHVERVCKKKITPAHTTMVKDVVDGKENKKQFWEHPRRCDFSSLSGKIYLKNFFSISMKHDRSYENRIKKFPCGKKKIRMKNCCSRKKYQKLWIWFLLSSRKLFFIFFFRMLNFSSHPLNSFMLVDAARGSNFERFS